MALAQITAKGAAVTFTRAVTTSYDPLTDTVTSGTATTVAGYAVRVKGDPERYRVLSLVETKAPTLLFAPTTYGSAPKEGDTLTWSSVAYTVRDVAPVAPDGTGIIYRVVVA